MTWKVEFEFTTPDGTALREVLTLVNDALQDMAARESRSGLGEYAMGRIVLSEDFV